MKKSLIAILVSAALVAPGMAQARDNRDDRHHQQTHVAKVEKAKVHKWKKGESFDRRQATNYREISYRDYRGLKAPPRGYHYVRSGDDILLVAMTSGVVGAVYDGLIR